jgi:hypothetical protein
MHSTEVVLDQLSTAWFIQSDSTAGTQQSENILASGLHMHTSHIMYAIKEMLVWIIVLGRACATRIILT